MPFFFLNITIGFSLEGRFGRIMIDTVNVFDGQMTSIDADTTDVSKAPVYQKLFDTTSVVAKNTPLGLQFLVTFSKTQTKLDGILGGYKLQLYSFNTHQKKQYGQLKKKIRMQTLSKTRNIIIIFDVNGSASSIFNVQIHRSF